MQKRVYLQLSPTQLKEYIAKALETENIDEVKDEKERWKMVAALNAVNQATKKGLKIDHIMQALLWELPNGSKQVEIIIDLKRI